MHERIFAFADWFDGFMSGIEGMLPDTQWTCLHNQVADLLEELIAEDGEGQ